MLSFLKIPIKFVLLFPAVVLAWTLVIGGPVTDLNLSLPFMEGSLDLQTPLELIADTMASLIAIMPWLEPMYQVLVWGLQIKVVLILVDIIWKVLSIFVQA